MRRRDFVILPLIVLLTLIVVIVPTEGVLRVLFPQNQADACMDYTSTDPADFHARAKCTSRTKIPEGPWVTNSYNDCGFRSPDGCGPKPKGALRVAIVGTSLSSGFMVPYDHSMTPMATAALNQTCKKPVDIQNLGAQGNIGPRLLASAQAAVALKPDIMVFVVSPPDLHLTDAVAPVGGDKAAHETNLMREVKVAISSPRLMYMESYLLLRNDNTYVPIYLRSGHNADYMRAPFSAEWQIKLAHLDADMAQLSGIAKQASIPLLVVYIPQRAQAAVLASPKLADHVDPLILPKEIKRISAAYGAGYADMGDEISRGLASSQIYYAMNGHLNGEGNTLLAHAMVKGIIATKGSPFGTVCHN